MSTDVLGGLGSKFLFHANQAVVEGSTFPDCFAGSRTVFIPKTSDTDDLGSIIRSPDAFRPLTLCNCDCKILTSAICRGLHWYTMRCIHSSQRCISSRQMTDNIFEIETTTLAHVACALQESGVLLTDFAAAYPVSITPESSRCLRRLVCPIFSAASYEVFSKTALLMWNLREQNKKTRLSCERLPIYNGF